MSIKTKDDVFKDFIDTLTLSKIKYLNYEHLYLLFRKFNNDYSTAAPSVLVTLGDTVSNFGLIIQTLGVLFLNDEDVTNFSSLDGRTILYAYTGSLKDSTPYAIGNEGSKKFLMLKSIGGLGN